MASPAIIWPLGDALSDANGLTLDGQSVAALAHIHGTPLYLYSAAAIKRRLAELQAALAQTGAAHRIHYAMKANRFEPLLKVMHEQGVQIDACSPREVELALRLGWRKEQVSVTAGMLSNNDLVWLANAGVHLNLDTFSALRRYSPLVRHDTSVGLRIDPGIKAGWGGEDRLAYGNAKFGFDASQVAEALEFAHTQDLNVDTLHVHVGWGLQQSAAPLLAQVYARMAAWAQAFPSVRTLNVGGGLCAKQRPEDDPLSLQTWSDLLREHLAATGCEIACEPGTFLTATAGLLVCEVNTVERRPHANWIGINAGHNVNVYPGQYGIPLALIPVAQPLAAANHKFNVAGNINEATDVWASDAALPMLQERDLLALYPVGAYGSSMASDHCMRGWAKEVMI